VTAGSLVRACASAALVSGCTDWSSFSRDYEGSDVCPAYVVAGDTHTCVRKTSGSLHCWGDNRYGQLGLGDTRARPTATRVPFDDVAKIYLPMGRGEISADAAGFTCAIDTQNRLFCWGDNRWGELGTPNERELSPVPVNLPGAPSVAAIGAGHICVLDAAGAATCFGNNSNSQLGVPGPNSPPGPIRVEGVLADKIVAGAHHTCVRTTLSYLLCFGL
jgi:alpha-tubulin suppressor-like RCC1 family protein